MAKGNDSNSQSMELAAQVQAAPLPVSPLPSDVDPGCGSRVTTGWVTGSPWHGSLPASLPMLGTSAGMVLGICG